MNRTRAPRFVALLGASAGGLEPLRELVAAMPRDPHLSCVVAQHIAAAEPSALARLLQSVTSTPVETVRDGVELRGGVIYVTPSGHHVELDGRRLRLQASVPGQGPAPSLDRLFASAARSLGTRALAIVLSGTGQDGAVGARVLRDAGGPYGPKPLPKHRLPRCPKPSSNAAWPTTWTPRSRWVGGCARCCKRWTNPPRPKRPATAP